MKQKKNRDPYVFLKSYFGVICTPTRYARQLTSGRKIYLQIQDNLNHVVINDARYRLGNKVFSAVEG